MCRSDRIRCSVASRPSRNSMIASRDMPGCHSECNHSVINHTLCASPGQCLSLCSTAPSVVLPQGVPIERAFGPVAAATTGCRAVLTADGAPEELLCRNVTPTCGQHSGSSEFLTGDANCLGIMSAFAKQPFSQAIAPKYDRQIPWAE